jgi:phage/conjugal plasmid C-4 type zinc finger TraR family protein
MTDVVDQAQELEQRERDRALAYQLSAHPVRHIIGDGEQIVDPRDCGLCHEPIPIVRLARDPFAKNCVSCQADIEKYEKA